jgi:hypothetical protein
MVTLRSKKGRAPPWGGSMVKFILAELTVGCLAIANRTGDNAEFVAQLLVCRISCLSTGSNGRADQSNGPGGPPAVG